MQKYIPALKYHFLTPAYDFIVKALMPEHKIRLKVLQLCSITGLESIFDFGCGTGTFCRIVKDFYPKIEITGYDVDSSILKKAISESTKNSIAIKYVLGVSSSLPFPTNHFDIVTSTWVFHHFTLEEKLHYSSEIYRILEPKGLIVIADWGKPSSFLMRTLFFLIQLIDNFKTTKENVEGKLPQMLSEIGFKNVQIVGSQSTLFGTLEYITAYK